ncbi:MAG: glycosyltransferase [Bryobacterales bacterium]|nr:glycosyltransferase [Bryobacterales bacterium]
MHQSAQSVRVLHVGKFYPPHMGGMETHLRDLASCLSSNMQVEVIVSNDSWRTEHQVTDGVSVRKLATLGVFASAPVSPTMALELRRTNADIVHLHFPNPAAAVAVLASGYRGPLVVTHQSDIVGKERLRRLTDPFVAEVMERASVVIATSRRYALSSAELRPYLRKCRVVPLGIPVPPTFLPAGGAGNESDAPPSVLAVGRLVPYKGFEFLIRAMVHVDARLTIVGTGPLHARLQSLIDSNRLTDRVRLLGYVEDLAPLYRAADVVVMPSITRAEAFGLVQLEAMSYGKPVINTDLDSGVPEVSLHGETGLTVPPSDVRALSDAISLLLQDHHLRGRLGAAAAVRFRAEFVAERMAARTAGIYREVLGLPPLQEAQAAVVYQPAAAHSHAVPDRAN